MNRREFLKNSALAAGGVVAGCATSGLPVAGVARDEFMWGALVHMGMNMWLDWQAPEHCGYSKVEREIRWPADHLRTDWNLWREWMASMAANRMNTIVIDIGEALVYPSHPELAVRGSLTPAAMRDELSRLRDLGITPYPKLNFSMTHNAWLKGYRRMASTSAYYRVCEDVIRDVAEIFGHPKYFHIGYDEETAGHQYSYAMAIVRQGELWWHDFLHIVRNVEKNGSRAWCFSDVIWHHPDQFRKNMPKSVLQCPWNFKESKDHPEYSQTVKDIVSLGYDLAPDLGTYSSKQPEGISEKESANWMAYAPSIPKAQLKGFLFCSWARPVPAHRQKGLKTFELAGRLRSTWEK